MNKQDELKLKYFVLNPSSSDYEQAKASIYGVRAYAHQIGKTSPKLQEDIFEWIERIKLKRVEDGKIEIV